MAVTLKRASEHDAAMILNMQIRSFAQMYEKYRDDQTSPAKETVDRVLERLRQEYTYYYLIMFQEDIVGAVRIVDSHKIGAYKRISPLFILPEFRNQGFAQDAIQAVEEIHGREKWSLDTIAEEKGNCYLYEKMGYRRTGRMEAMNDRMTIVHDVKE